jgi:hypothetical protein
MLGAIILDPNPKKLTVGNYFVKFYGPAATVAENEQTFLEMLDSLKVK